MATLREVKKRIRTVKLTAMNGLSLIVMPILLVASSTYGFDGKRKGLVLGGGLGIAPVSRYERPAVLVGNYYEKGAGVGLNLIIGYGWDERNLIVYEGNVTGWSSDDLNKTISQGFNGAAWYHYFGQTGHSVFSTVGVGVYVFEVEGLSANNMKAGILMGGGYAFARHWQIGGYLGFGQTSDGGRTIDHSHLNILMSALAL